MEHPWAQIAEARAELERRIDGAEIWDDSCEAAAYEYARLMVEAGVRSHQAARRLQRSGLTYEGAWELLGKAAKAKALAEKQAEDAALADATPLCPHCMTPVGPFDHFCPKCAGPVTAIASMDPMGQIYSAGRAYRLAATDKKPKGVVVLGMWLIFAPALVSILFWALFIVSALLRSNSDRYESFEINPPTIGPILWFVLAAGMLALYAAILYKVTKHWLQEPDQPEGTGRGEDDESSESSGDEGA